MKVRVQDAGLCSTCTHSRTLQSARGSVFRLCRLHERDPRFPKYPSLPVQRCPGHAPNPPRNEQENP